MASAEFPTGSHDDESATKGAPVWVVSFADMSLLMLGFFIMLVAVSSRIPATDQDLIRILASIKVGFGYRPDASSRDELDIAVLQMLATRTRGPYKSTLGNTTPAIRGKTIRDKDRWVRVRGVVGKAVFFRQNSAALPATDDVTDNLNAIATLVRDHFRRVVIHGHCSSSEARRNSGGGHALSFRRAAAVRRELIARGVNSDRIRIVSCANHDREPETAARVDRRVEITLSSYYLPGKDIEF